MNALIWTEGYKVAFIEEENGMILITKSSVVSLRELLDSMGNYIQEKDVTKEGGIWTTWNKVREEI